MKEKTFQLLFDLKYILNGELDSTSTGVSTHKKIHFNIRLQMWYTLDITNQQLYLIEAFTFFFVLRPTWKRCILIETIPLINKKTFQLRVLQHIAAVIHSGVWCCGTNVSLTQTGLWETQHPMNTRVLFSPNCYPAMQVVYLGFICWGFCLQYFSADVLIQG